MPTFTLTLLCKDSGVDGNRASEEENDDDGTEERADIAEEGSQCVMDTGMSIHLRVRPVHPPTATPMPNPPSVNAVIDTTGPFPFFALALGWLPLFRPCAFL